MSILIAIIVFGIIVVIHEFGHFIMARRAGIMVVEFAIGMGPKLFGIKKGETLYTIRLLPLGGFCLMLGEDGSSEDNRALNNKSVLARMSVMVAGSAMNFLLAFVIFFILTSANGFNAPVVNQVMPGYPAETANLQIGDRIMKINSTRINIYSDLSFALNDGLGNPVKLLVKRGGEYLDIEIIPKATQNEDGNTQYLIGFYCERKIGLFSEAVEGLQRVGILESLTHSFWTILFYIKVTVLGIIRLFTLKLNIGDMSGAIGIVQMIGETYDEGIKVGIWYTIQNLLSFTAFLSANLGVFNLLPLPALDGGRLAFLTVEGIRKKPIDRDKEGLIHFAGFVLLMVLAVYIAYSDIMKML